MNHPSAQQLLAEVDGVLEQLKTLAASAPAGVAPSLEPIRLAIVDGGVKLAGALSQLVPEAVVQPALGPPKAAAVRVLSNERQEALGHRQPKALWIVLGVVVALAASYHSWVRIARPIVPPKTVANAPSNTIGMVRGKGKVVTALAGKPIDPAELERFKAAEQAKGNVVKEVSPGMWIVVPETNARAQAPGEKP